MCPLKIQYVTQHMHVYVYIYSTCFSFLGRRWVFFDVLLAAWVDVAGRKSVEEKTLYCLEESVCLLAIGSS